MSGTLVLLKDIPMKTQIKEQFIARLQDLRNFVAADVSQVSGKPLKFSGEEGESDNGEENSDTIDTSTGQGDGTQRGSGRL